MDGDALCIDVVGGFRIETCLRDFLVEGLVCDTDGRVEAERECQELHDTEEKAIMSSP